jgi:hypothetical protein
MIREGKFKKGQVANPNGRPVGSKNRLPRDLVDQVLEISADLDREGKGLHACARKNPWWFYQNFVKPILPKNVNLETDHAPVRQTIQIQFVPEKTMPEPCLFCDKPERNYRPPANVDFVCSMCVVMICRANMENGRRAYKHAVASGNARKARALEIFLRGEEEHDEEADQPERDMAENDLCRRLDLPVTKSGRSLQLNNWVRGGLRYVEKSGRRYFFEQDVIEYLWMRSQTVQAE